MMTPTLFIERCIMSEYEADHLIARADQFIKNLDMLGEKIVRIRTEATLSREQLMMAKKAGVQISDDIIDRADALIADLDAAVKRLGNLLTGSTEAEAQ